MLIAISNRNVIYSKPIEIPLQQAANRLCTHWGMGAGSFQRVLQTIPWSRAQLMSHGKRVILHICILQIRRMRYHDLNSPTYC